MMFVRTFPMIALAAIIAGCSGNLGGGQSTLPGTPQTGSNVQSVAQAAPTPSPVSASNVATLSDSGAPQPIPPYEGWGGTIAFAKPQASASPAPNAKGTPAGAADSGASPITIGITSSVVEPSEAPHFSSASTKRHVKRDPSVPAALFFITLLPTADVTLTQYPRIAIDVPRDVATKYHDQAFRLALYDPETKAKSYRLDVAQRDLNAPDIGSVPATPVPTPVPTPIPTPVTSPGAFPFGMPGGPSPPATPPAGGNFERSSLPPQEIAFLPTATALTLHENQPVFFALYVVAPSPSPSPSPTTKAAASGSPSPKASTGNAPTAASSPSPAPAPSATATATPTSTR